MTICRKGGKEQSARTTGGDCLTETLNAGTGGSGVIDDSYWVDASLHKTSHTVANIACASIHAKNCNKN